MYYQGWSHDAHGRSQKSNKIVKDKVKAQSRQSARLFLQLSELGPSHPLTAGECAPLPPLLWGRDTLACAGGWGVPQFGRGDRHCGTLGIYVLCG
jgi:hypothetical protein